MRHIFLIGLSGSGKSSLGRLLAQRLGRPLLDLDARIEEECGERIPAVFARGGEAYFRACESRVLRAISETHEGAVIATGGGVVVRAENRELMAARGVRLYLAVEPAVALQRMRAQHAAALAQGDVPELRPLLAGPDPLTALQELLAARMAWYEEAELICTTSGKSLEYLVQESIAMLIGSGELDSTSALVRHVRVGDGYDAIVDWGGLGRLSSYLTQLQVPPRVFLITDSNVQRLYAQPLMTQLAAAGFEPSCYSVPAGEASKSFEQLQALYNWLLEQRAERREAIVALGGGVVGDLAGFVAASYLRGVPLIHVPTSLLAQVDSSIGGKTGINHPKGKNLIGAFYHPRLVLADPATLLTLPERERTEGWAEVVKYGIILDAALFAQLEAHADELRDFRHPPVALLCQLIARSIALKADVIEGDEREQGRRAILNYGHTIGHALENAAGYGEWLHGEAVAIGMAAAASIAHQAHLCASSDVERQNRLLTALGLPITYRGTVGAQAILAALQMDKKVANKQVRWVMLRRIGEVDVMAMPDVLVQQVVTAFFPEESKS